jgi:hypothetical protein
MGRLESCGLYHLERTGDDHSEVILTVVSTFAILGMGEG